MQYFLAQNSTCYNIGMLCFFRDKWSNNSTHIFITFMTLKGSQNSPEHSTSSFELPRHDVLFSQRTRRKTAFSHKLWKHMTETRKELRHFIGRLHILRPPPRGAHVTENDLLILHCGRRESSTRRRNAERRHSLPCTTLPLLKTSDSWLNQDISKILFNMKEWGNQPKRGLTLRDATVYKGIVMLGIFNTFYFIKLRSGEHEILPSHWSECGERVQDAAVPIYRFQLITRWKRFS